LNKRLRRHGITTRKELYKGSLLEGGHAEMENNNILFLYGNAFEVMLPNQSFQDTVEEVNILKYINFNDLDPFSVCNLRSARPNQIHESLKAIQELEKSRLIK